MSITQQQIQEFMNFFSGAQRSYGKLIYSNSKKGEKVTGAFSTIKDKLITLEEYKNHLTGQEGLGVIPINEGNRCKFGVIDIDIYDSELSLYVDAIERNEFPLVPFKSKSGGLHVYLFLKEEAPARKVVETMKQFASLLAIDVLVKQRKDEFVEIFPKQINLKKGDIGNWINLPYYNEKETKQYLVSEGKGLTLSQALKYIRDKQVSFNEIDRFFNEVAYSDAPPCLQTLYILNPFGENSSRNNYLFSFGVYLKKKDKEFFEQALMEVNQLMPEPLPDKEVERTILNSLRKKDYIYKCKENPCVDYCNKERCREREYGIGKEDGHFSLIEFGKLSQYKTLQPYYEWMVKLRDQEDFKCLQFKSESELLRQEKFSALCIRELHLLPPMLKQKAWNDLVNQALMDIVIVNVDLADDTSPVLTVRNYILEFITSESHARTRQQILLGRAFYDTREKCYYFRNKDIVTFIAIEKGYKDIRQNELHSIIREMGGTSHIIRDEINNQIRVTKLTKKILKDKGFDVDKERFVADDPINFLNEKLGYEPEDY